MGAIFKAEILCLQRGFRLQRSKFLVVYLFCFTAQGSGILFLFVTVRHLHPASRTGTCLLWPVLLWWSRCLSWASAPGPCELWLLMIHRCPLTSHSFCRLEPALAPTAATAKRHRPMTQTTETYFPPVLEAGNPRPRCRQDRFPEAFLACGWLPPSCASALSSLCTCLCPNLPFFREQLSC